MSTVTDTQSATSGSAAEIVRGMYEAFQDGDLQAVLAGMHPDVEWVITGPDAIPYAGTWRGVQGVTEFFRTLAESAEIEALEPQEFVEQGDRLVVLGRERERSRRTGRTAEYEWAMAFTLRDGKVARFQSYFDTAAVAGIAA